MNFKIIITLLTILVLSQSVMSQAQDCKTITFSSLSAGEKVTTQISGVTISADNNNGPDEAIVFDSSAPTGQDFDLGTPNSDFSGPGIGSGGNSGAAGENSVAKGNILIIAEDLVDSNNDNLVDDPDDDLHGGKITFVFDNVVELVDIMVLDIDQETSMIKVFNSADTLIKTVNSADVGNNGVQILNINQAGAKKLEVSFSSSGALDDLQYCEDGEEEIPEFSTIGAAIALAGAALFIMRRK